VKQNQQPTWRETINALRDCRTEAEAQAIYDKEFAGPKRHRWLEKARGRVRELRRQRENAELAALGESTNA
jgi:hypothetical protein